MRRIASFDIGASHLACVVVDADAKTVIHWSKDALPSLNSRDVVQYVRSLPLDPHAALTALVEQQPAIWVQSTRTWTTNPKMLRLEGMISSALAALGAEVIHRATSHKTAYLNANKALLARTYKDRKHLGVALVRDVVLPLHADGGPVADGLCTFFADPREKKDDLADALLQVMCACVGPVGVPSTCWGVCVCFFFGLNQVHAAVHGCRFVIHACAGAGLPGHPRQRVRPSGHPGARGASCRPRGDATRGAAARVWQAP